MNVGRAKVKDQQENQRKATFADVAGADEEKAELQEVVEFLKAPNKFNSLGARIPPRRTACRPSGYRQTLLARACAGEAGVPFYAISGSDFVEMYVGVGASRVRDLFEKAKKTMLPSSSLMRSTRWAVSAAQVSAAVTMSASRP